MTFYLNFGSHFAVWYMVQLLGVKGWGGGGRVRAGGKHEAASQSMVMCFGGTDTKLLVFVKVTAMESSESARKGLQTTFAGYGGVR